MVVIKGDTKSLDYSSFFPPPPPLIQDTPNKLQYATYGEYSVLGLLGKGYLFGGPHSQDYRILGSFCFGKLPSWIAVKKLEGIYL